MFLHVSVYPRGGGSTWAGTPPTPGRYTLLTGTPTPWAGTPPCQVHPLGRYSPQAGTTPPREQCMLGDTGNKRVVHILLECILVSKLNILVLVRISRISMETAEGLTCSEAKIRESTPTLKLEAIDSQSIRYQCPPPPTPPRNGTYVFKKIKRDWVTSFLNNDVMTLLLVERRNTMSDV